jgi:ATP-dependent RNA helicase DeaD
VGAGPAERGPKLSGGAIADRFSLVEVRAEHAEAIVHALRGTTLRGRKVVVRRDRES